MSLAARAIRLRDSRVLLVGADACELRPRVSSSVFS